MTSINEEPRPFWPVRAQQLAVALQTRRSDEGDFATMIARRRIREALLNFPDNQLDAAAHRLERALSVAIARLLTSDMGVDYGAIGLEISKMRSVGLNR